MKKFTVAFDVDGTLINNRSVRGTPVANEDIRTLLIILSKFKNVRIVVWSGGGELYARQVASAIGISKYVHEYASKNHVDTVDGEHQFAPDIKPDIAIDDIQACTLGTINLIVKQK